MIQTAHAVSQKSKFLGITNRLTRCKKETVTPSVAVASTRVEPIVKRNELVILIVAEQRARCPELDMNESELSKDER